MDTATILFDGVCNLCHAGVRFVIANDPQARFRFVALESETARTLLAAHARDPRTLASVVLIDRDGIHVRSDAALRIAGGLRAPWPLIRIVALVPRSIRDIVYDWVARNRYRWFGKRDICPVPTPAQQARFL